MPRPAARNVEDPAGVFSAQDLYLFREGTHRKLHDKLGVHREGDAFRFTLWAPAARNVAVTGDFNDWSRKADPLEQIGDTGIWTGLVGEVEPGHRYKFRIESRNRGGITEKADPFARLAEEPPRTASVVYESSHQWGDEAWMEARAGLSRHDRPLSIYEMHAGSWRRKEAGRPLTYRELADELPSYLSERGFTHVEFLPLTEHPFYGSWGYQTTGYFAPTSRYGDPDELRGLVDALHTAGLGVIIDWVPSHFPSDGHGLGFFDGTHLFEHADPRKGFHPDWNSYIFNYDRGEVRSFLISSALWWLDSFHVDGLRVDAVASMLYLDYSRKEGEWIPNRYGGRENIGAIIFLRELNAAIREDCPAAVTIAEESTAWPGVTKPLEVGGLGFDYKWDMGWMHDTLGYFERDPIHRRYHHNEITFRMMYAFTENFVLPLSHDEVVHGKRSLLEKMPGDRWQKFANLRALYCYMWTQPGAKLLFMGGELGQKLEWNHEGDLAWTVEDPLAHGIRDLVAKLNALYGSSSQLHELDHSPAGFEWIDPHDADRSILSYYRIDRQGSRVCIVLNLTPTPVRNYLIGCAETGEWELLLNSDEPEIGGSGFPVVRSVRTNPVPSQGRFHSFLIDLPPLAALIYGES